MVPVEYRIINLEAIMNNIMNIAIIIVIAEKMKLP
jgi:hypothetical protein